MSKKPIAYRGSEPFVFVSYAHLDAELAYPLISGLQERGLRVWFDEGIEAGELWDEVIPDYVEQCAAMLCLVSTRFTDSSNCKNEIRYANELKKEVLILHLEDGELPRYIRFHYSSIHALRLRDYSDRGRLLEKLVATPKLQCCLRWSQEETQEPEERSEEILQEGEACAEVGFSEEDIKLYQINANQGDVGAMSCLGYCYVKGIGVSQSYEEAAKWFRLAADKGDAKAMTNLGLCYELGKGVSQSYEEAVKLYRQAADKGEATAMCQMGYCYLQGYGVLQSEEEAARWYRQAADRNHAEATFRLGLCYFNGFGASQSYKEAVKWFRLAADRGAKGAMRLLGICYKHGWGVAMDQKQADYWNNKAKEVKAKTSN